MSTRMVILRSLAGVILIPSIWSGVLFLFSGFQIEGWMIPIACAAVMGSGFMWAGCLASLFVPEGDPGHSSQQGRTR